MTGSPTDLPSDQQLRVSFLPRFPGIVAILVGLAALSGLTYLLFTSRVSPPSLPSFRTPFPSPGPELALETFSSQAELEDFIKKQTEAGPSYGWLGITGGAIMRDVESSELGVPAAQKVAPEAGGAGAEDYSTTNIQVAGVDEADIVKNDNKYIYLVSGGKVVIIDAYPAEQAKVVSEIEVGGTPTELFINKDRLVVFGQERESIVLPTFPEKKILPPSYNHPKAYLKIFDLADRSNPRRIREVTTRGTYVDSRMIDKYVYVIIHHPPFVGYFGEDADGEIPLPAIEENGQIRSIGPTEISYFPMPYYEPRLTTILAINTQEKDESYSKRSYLMDVSDSLYVSPRNIFIVHQRRQPPYEIETRMLKDVVLPILPTGVAEQIRAIDSSDSSSEEKWERTSEILADWSELGLTVEEESRFEQQMEQRMTEFSRRIAKETEKTIVHRIRINDSRIQYQAQGEVPGHVLNQFSMDENQGRFRIATTTGEFWGGTESTANHVYVLDNELNIIGRLEDLAPGESIFSARFMGDRAYLVTFRKVDPLFVVDLKDPRNPRLLGKLKIPGYSDYLHPYDENHLIGIGKESVEAKEGDFSWYQGVKVALFDVSDPERPKELSKYEVGDRGTDSYVLRDHKAFLFSRPKNLMVIPILLAEIDEEKYPQGVSPSTHGDYTWQGAYVFDISQRGINLRGRVTHLDSDDVLDKSGFYLSSPASIKRSLFMDDTLYTVSDLMVKMNDLVSLHEVNGVRFPTDVWNVRPWYEEPIQSEIAPPGIVPPPLELPGSPESPISP